MNLTPRQLDAVDVTRRGQDTCIVAGPGSGKTTVLVEYFRRLVAAGVPPQRILAITFTEKAASNMKEKLADLPRQLEHAYVSTVHGFCVRLLRENAIFAGVDPEFRVLDERQAAQLQGLTLNEAIDKLFAERPETLRALIKGLASGELSGALIGAYEAMRAAGVRVEDLPRFQVTPRFTRTDLAAAVSSLETHRPVDWSDKQRSSLDEFLASCRQILEGAGYPELQFNLTRFKRGNPIYDGVVRIRNEIVPALERTYVSEFYETQRQTLIEIMRRFDGLYRERKQQLGVLDFADLEDYAVRLLEERGVPAQFDRVLMDEFQDTNGQQAKLLELVRTPGHFYAVGDINQSIYGFRHAEPEIFRKYRDDVAASGGSVVELVENWRSRPEILRAVETIAHPAAGLERRPLVPAREFAQKVEPSVEVISALREELESQWVARRIRELERTTARFGDIAVLVRNSEVFGAFTKAFDEFHVPYLVSRGKGFYELREVNDLTHLLRILLNARDEISMAAVLRSPFVEASDEALLRLKQSGNLGMALEKLNGDPDDLERLKHFRDRLHQWRALRHLVSFDRLLQRAMDETGYEGRRANIEKFLAIAREASSRQTLAEFVEELELLRKSDPREPEAAPDDAVNAVKLMTVHSAKGLEFPVVFLAALHKRVDQSLGTLSFSPRLGLGARWRNPETGEDKDDWFLHFIREERRQREAHERDRLFYVAMTRAEEHLVMSFSRCEEWAAMLKEGLGADLATPRDEIETFTSPYGEPFRVRILCTATAPERFPPPASVDSRDASEAVVRPAVTEQHDAAASVTSVTLFAQCPRRYYLGRYLGWQGGTRARLRDEDEKPEALDASELGIQVHELLAGKLVPQPHPEAPRLAELFRFSELGRRAARAASIEREFDFLLAVDDVVLRGQIDLWFEEAGELVLVDYKTDAVEAAAAAEHAQAYALQLRLYALALEQWMGKTPDRAFIYLLRPNVAVPIETGLADARHVVRDFREAQSALEFPLREAEHCRRCPFFRGLCPATLPPGPALERRSVPEGAAMRDPCSDAPTSDTQCRPMASSNRKGTG